MTVDQMLVATGRDPSARGLGLEELGVKLDGRGHVIVDHRMATKVRGVYAAGDVTGRLPFTHAADDMGRLADGNELGKAIYLKEPQTT